MRTSFKYSSGVKVPMFVFTLQFEKFKQVPQNWTGQMIPMFDVSVFHFVLNLLAGASSNVTVKTCHALLSLPSN